MQPICTSGVMRCCPARFDSGTCERHASGSERPQTRHLLASCHTPDVATVATHIVACTVATSAPKLPLHHVTLQRAQRRTRQCDVVPKLWLPFCTASMEHRIS